MSITPSPGSMLPGDQPEQRQASSQPPTPQYYATPAAPAETRNWFQPVVLGGLVLLAITNGYLYYRIGQTQDALDQRAALLQDRNAVLEKRLAAADQRTGALSGELQSTRQRLGLAQRDLSRTREATENLTEEQKRALDQIGQVGQQVTTLRDEAGQKFGALGSEVTGAKTDIASTRKDLEQTRLQLTSAMGDISKAQSLIARNHDELVELKRRGERNYLEFNLGKEKQPRRVGDISLLLKKSDPKRQKYTLEVIAEDARTEKKDRNVNEPVQFYMGRSRTLYEIVVNRVGKDQVAGYLATPK